MYYLQKTFAFAAAHKLVLPYESGCNNLHDHNWTVTVHMRGAELHDHGMLMDFKHIKDKIQSQFDQPCSTTSPRNPPLNISPNIFMTGLRRCAIAWISSKAPAAWRVMRVMRMYNIVEIFKSLQGEGVNTSKEVVFICSTWLVIFATPFTAVAKK